jgi:hypothetical protein
METRAGDRVGRRSGSREPGMPSSALFVALKVVRPEVAADPKAAAMLEGGNAGAVSAAASTARVHALGFTAVLVTAPQAVQRPLETLASPPQLGQFINKCGWPAKPW